MEVPLGEFDKTNVESMESDTEIAEDILGTLSIEEQELSKSRVYPETDIPTEEKELEETYIEQESVESISTTQVQIFFLWFLHLRFKQHFLSLTGD